METKVEVTWQVREGAIKTLNGMKQIARNEMLKPGHYVSGTVEDPELAKKGAVCGGHSACLIGSLYIAGGVKFREVGRTWDEQRIVDLPGVKSGRQKEYMARRPHLRLAWDALNDAAEVYLRKLPQERQEDVREGSKFEGRAETVFENAKIEDRAEQIKLIDGALRRVRKLEVA